MPTTQYYFVHLPKCAGTSVLKSLARIGSRRYVILSESPNSKQQAMDDLQAELKRRSQSIEEIDLVMGHDVFYGMHDISTRPSFYFTILRDPVARYISNYCYLADCAQNRRSRIHDFAKAKMMPSGKLLSMEECVDRKYWQNHMTNHLATANHPDPSIAKWQIENADEQFRLASEFIDQMGFVGFVETLEQDMDTLCARFGLKYKLKVFNRSKTGVVDNISEQTAKKIQELNQLDQQLYDRAFNRDQR